MPDGGGGADGAGRIKGSWSPEEDELLRDAVARHGARNWTVISAEIPGRTGKSCRLRWCNQLSPGVHRRAFTPDEDRLIFEEHAKHGNKWATIARKLQGRTDNSVKNHWNSTLRKRRRAAAAAAAAAAGNGPVFSPAAAMSFQSVDLTKGGEDHYDDSDGSVEPPAKRPCLDVGGAVHSAVKLDDQAPPPDPPTSLSLSLPGTGAGAVTPPAPPTPAPAPAPAMPSPAKDAWMERARAVLEQIPCFNEVMKQMIADEVKRQIGSACSMASLGRDGAGAATLPAARVDRAETHPAGGRDQRTDG